MCPDSAEQNRVGFSRKRRVNLPLSELTRFSCLGARIFHRVFESNFIADFAYFFERNPYLFC